MKAQVKVDGIVVQLWDTPGFDDSGHKDALIFHEIVKKMCDAESKGYGINGVILLEPVIEPRVKGSDRSRIKMLMETIGSNAFGRVAVVGTKWDKVNQATAEKGEGNRSNGVWKELIDEGARVFRFDGKQAAALQIVRHFVTNRQGFAPFTPQVVAQLQNNSGNLAQTSAYTALDGTLAQREHGAREESKLLGGDKELEEMASNISAARKWLKKQIVSVFFSSVTDYLANSANTDHSMESVRGWCDCAQWHRSMRGLPNSVITA